MQTALENISGLKSPLMLDPPFSEVAKAVATGVASSRTAMAFEDGIVEDGR